MKTLSCVAPHGTGGLGQHFAEVVEATRAQGQLARYYSLAPKSGDALGQTITTPQYAWRVRYTPVRLSPGAKNHLANELFNHAVVRVMTAVSESFCGFGGQALHSFRKARALGAQQLELVAANSHVNNVARRHAQASKQYGFEASWLNSAQIAKTLREYEMADVIWVASEYTRQTFLAEGVPAAKLRRIHYRTAARFAPPSARPTDGKFRIAYVGALTTFKGVPLLREVMQRWDAPNVELTLVGGWATRGMRRYIQEWLAADPRVRVAPGDPLPALHQADVCVHPTYEDGWSYAPVEALACGVSVIVTQDTGMKEMVEEGVNGYVVPTGDWQAIHERLEHLRCHPLPMEQAIA